MSSFVQELRARRIHTAAVGYVAIASLLTGIAALIFSRLQLPNWTLPALVVVLLAGFPALLIWHWHVDVTAGFERRVITGPPAAGMLPLLVSGSVLLSVIIGTIAVPKSYEFMAKTKPPSDADVEIKVKEVLWKQTKYGPRPELIPGSAKLHGPPTPDEPSLALDAATDLGVIDDLNDYIKSFQPKHLITKSDYAKQIRVVNLIDLVIAKLKPDPPKPSGND